jgi:hypothetical protein
MNVALRPNVARLWLSRTITSAILLMTLSASPSPAEISDEVMQQCAALTNSVRRLTCYDLLAKLPVAERPETTARNESVVRLQSELMSKIDAWIQNQPEPKPGRSEAIRRLLEQALQLWITPSS